MFDLLSSLKHAFKAHPIRIEGFIFRLHYRITTVMLLCACMMVTARQYFGDPIVCIPPNRDEVPKDALETFCWIHATFTLAKAHQLEVGVHTIYPGVGFHEPQDEKIYYQYYQWVCFVLFFQAMLFYLPHYIWKGMENQTIRKILLELNYPVRIPKKRDESRMMLADYLQSTARTHNAYAYKYILCECLNLLNVLAQIYLVDEFLGNEFSTYGTRVIRFTTYGDSEQRVDPLNYVFPRVTKCSFRKFGPSGTIQLHDALCILPLNIVNEKIYVFMWFWFVVLAILTSLYIMAALPVLMMNCLRAKLLRLENRFADADEISMVVSRIGLGDWLVLRFLADNMDPMNFKAVVHMLIVGPPTSIMVVDAHCANDGSGDHGGPNNNGEKLLQETEEP